MIKIFSIKEIIDASENILNSSKKTEEKQLNPKKPKHKKAILTNLNKPIKDNEPLILKTEIEENKLEIRKKDNIKKSTQKYTHTNFDNNQTIINELYKLFGKKIKKSTLKIIVEQQNEIKKLKNDLSLLRRNEYRNLKINKELKNKIVDLSNNEKILNFKINQIQEKLNNSIKNEEKLLEVNEKLTIDILKIKETLALTIQTKDTLEVSNIKLQKTINDLLIDNEKLNKTNNNNESNILLLKNAKNHLFNEIESLKEDLKLINENKKILITNNEKLQKETTLLEKNKVLLIEINDKYQKQVNELQLNQNEIKEESLAIKNKLSSLADEKKLIQKKNDSLYKDNKIINEKLNLITDKNLTLVQENKKIKIENYKKEKEFLVRVKDNQKNLEIQDQLNIQIANLIEKENSLLKKTKKLEKENNFLKNNNEFNALKENPASLDDINKNLKNEISALKISEMELIENNNKLNNELSKLKSTQDTFIKDNELDILKQKLNFHQDENLRLSHELSNSQKKYKIIKDQLNEIEEEKTKISDKISDLSSSLDQSKFVINPFKRDNKIKKKDINQENEISTLDLSEEIKKIFNK